MDPVLPTVKWIIFVDSEGTTRQKFYNYILYDGTMLLVRTNNTTIRNPTNEMQVAK